MKENSWVLRLAVELSKLMQRGVFDVVKKYCRGSVLDVGGRDYYLRVRGRVAIESWTCLEYDGTKLLQLNDPNYTCVQGDGCAMTFDSDSFDTVINMQVLEHVFEPIKMVREIARVLKPGGHGVLIIPQTIDLHMAPAHFQNFTRYWIVEAMREANLEIVELIPMGGVWKTLASRNFLFFFHAFRIEGWHSGIQRPKMFYVLFPFMALWALINIPICMVLSLGDLVEEANNHLVVVRKPTGYT